MDHIDEYLATASQNIKYSKAIRAALALGKQTLNRYYDKTDQSEVYRIAMGRSLHVSFYLFCSHLLQFSTLDINYTISRKLDGMKIGLRLPKTLFVLSLIKHMHLWMLMSTSRSLRLLALLCVFQLFSILHADISFSAHFPLPKTSLTSCQHFLPLQSLTSVMSWIVISALTLSMLPMLWLGGMRSGSFILASTVWHWIT
jgi:hypothetical protein